MTLRNQQDAAAAALFILLGAGGLAMSFSYRLGTLLQMGPGFFPALIFSGLLITGILTAIRAARRDGPSIEHWPWRAIVAIIAAIVVFALTIRPLGTMAATALTVVVAGLGEAGVRPLRLLGVAVVLATATTLIFVTGLGLPLKVWP